MKRVFLSLLLLCPLMGHAVFNPVSGDQLWAIAAETGRIASAIEGTQTRIQSSDIGTTGYTISVPGRYALVENVTYTAAGTASAISIESDDVFLDLNGFTITGAGAMSANLIQVDSSHANIYIGNGTLNSATARGILVSDSCSEVRLDRINVHQAATRGIEVAGAMGLEVVNLLIVDCDVSESQGSQGILLTYVLSARVVNTVVATSAASHGIDAQLSENLVVDYCQLIGNNMTGINLASCANISVVNCFLSNNTRGVQTQISGMNAPTINLNIEGCQFFDHSSNAIDLGVGSERISILNVESSGDFRGIGISADTDDRSKEICVENMCIFGATVGGTSGAIQVGEFVTSVDFENVTIDQPAGVGFRVADATSGFTFRNCLVSKAGNSGFHIDGPTDQFVFEDCISNGNGDDGFLISNPNGIDFVRCVAENNQGRGFYINHTQVNLNPGVFFDGCRAIRNDSLGFWIDSIAAPVVTDVVSQGTIQNCLAERNGNAGFQFFFQHGLVQNNRAIENNAANFVIEGGLGAGRNMIIDNSAVKSDSGTGANFQENAGGSYSNVYIGNAAVIGNVVIGTVQDANYDMMGTSRPKITRTFEGTNGSVGTGVFAADPLPYRWFNLSAQAD